MSPYDPYAPNADRSIPVNTPTPLDGPVVLVPYDPNWPAMFEAEAAHVRRALGDKALVLEHVGSTSVPGLLAKPCIDMVLGVADAADEDDYVPQLDAAGFVLRIRQPAWNEHRVFKSERVNINLHVWSADSSEIARHINFRDWLRTHPEDMALYATSKQATAAGDFATMPEYADAKNGVIREIQARIDAAYGTST